MTIHSLIRVTILIILFGATLIGLLSIPTPTPDLQIWLIHFWASKLIAIVSALILTSLYRRWRHTDQIIARYHANAFKGLN
ncbi:MULTISPECIES: hypothetical protein [Muribaculum]|uniref:hypothetical protein n=1 Tax=Muribaculum TaxID=1918540 RepID=UPI0023C46A80|nr:MULTISPECIES: hypothetical protein [Muribaculum]MDE5705137.1 hypothetical protein [Muribaculum sp.]